jgi:copper(I)-binding protein
MLRFARAAFAAAILFATPALAHNGVVHLGPLNISGPFSRATLPNAPVGGGFLTIENTGETADRLVSASSPAAAEVQIHEMKMEGEVMRMRALPDGLDLPPGETIVLAPGGFHLMLMGLTQPLVEGEAVPVTLTFEQAGTVEVLLPVLGTAADAPEHEGHH